MTETPPTEDTIKNSHFYPPKEQGEVGKKKKFKPIRLLIWVLIVFILYFLFTEKQALIFVDGRIQYAYSSFLAQYVAIFIAGVTCVFLSLHAHIFIHELGHVAAGFLVQKKLLLISVGRWRYELTLRGFRFRKGGRVAGVSGVAAMVDDITQQASSSRLRTAVYMFGGAFANIMVGTLVFMLTYFWADHKVASMMLTIFAVTGVLIGLSNLVPRKTQGWETDGLQIWKALRGQGNVVDAKSTYLASSTYCGLQSKDWPEEKLPTIDEIEEEGVSVPTKISAYVVRLEYALATQRVEMGQESALWLAQHFNAMSDGVKQQVAYSQCVFAILGEGDASLFQAWRPKCEGGFFNLEPRLHWIDAEHAFIAGDKEQANSYIEKTRNTLLDLPTINAKEFIEGRLNKLSAQINQ